MADILLLSSEELQALLNRPDDADGIRQRAHERIPYRLREGIEIDLLDKHGRATRARVAPRDISRGGIGVLHHGAIAGGTRVIVLLPSSAGDTISVGGRVVCCFGLAGEVYDIGIAFDVELKIEPILARARFLQSTGEDRQGR